MVSDLGRVRSLVSKRELRQFTNIDGYLVVNLTNKQTKQIKVHRLVLLAFRGPSPKGQVSRHGNGIRTDNRLSNLLYGTHQENSADRKRHGTVVRGMKSPNAKLTEAQVIEIRSYLNPKGKHTELAKQYGVSQSLITGIINRRTWKHI